jgi:hypothetical protein
MIPYELFGASPDLAEALVTLICVPHLTSSEKMASTITKLKNNILASSKHSASCRHKYRR